MEMIRYIGILDRRFRQHCSDSEYCLRANKNGWQVVAIPASKVQHNHQTTINHLKISPQEDQKKFLDILSGHYYKELMDRMPLDCDESMWGRITFEYYKKDDSSNKSTTA